MGTKEKEGIIVNNILETACTAVILFGGDYSVKTTDSKYDIGIIEGPVKQESQQAIISFTKLVNPPDGKVLVREADFLEACKAISVNHSELKSKLLKLVS